MANDREPTEVDLTALLESVHGKSDLEFRQDQLEQALKAIETTHRRASLAIRQFERTGKTAAESAAIAALGALADDAGFAASAARAGAEATDREPSAKPAQSDIEAGPVATPAGPPAAEVTAVYAPPATSEKPQAEEVTKTAVRMPSEAEAGDDARWAAEPTQILPAQKTPPPLPAGSADERKAPADDAAVPPAQVVAGRGRDFGRAEVTRTKIIRRKKP